MRNDNWARRRGHWHVWAVALGTILLWACSFDVINPGPVEDHYLDDPAAHQALVNGMGRAFASALNQVSYTGAAVTREVHPGGTSGNFGITQLQQQGYLEDDEVGTHWSNAQLARWVSDQGIERLKAVLSADEFAKSKLVAQAYLWNGYSYRLLGENMCEVTIDGGPAQPTSVALDRAEAAFSQAMSVAAAAGDATIGLAALAGRASVRLLKGDWANAVADAGGVSSGFAYTVSYHNVGVDELYNRIFWSSGETPFRAHTMWNTVYEDYYTATNDPRVAWLMQNKVGDGATVCCGQVPFWPQRKYPTAASPIRVSSGTEMRLIEAEALLVNNDWNGAMTIINAIRAAVGVATVTPWTATNQTEAWARLKRERGIVLWLEGRRLADIRRWQAAGTPGALDPLEEGDPAHLMADRDLCFPISLAEKQTNPNLGQ